MTMQDAGRSLGGCAAGNTQHITLPQLCTIPVAACQSARKRILETQCSDVGIHCQDRRVAENDPSDMRIASQMKALVLPARAASRCCTTRRTWNLEGRGCSRGRALPTGQIRRTRSSCPRVIVCRAEMLDWREPFRPWLLYSPSFKPQPVWHFYPASARSPM